MSEFEQSPGGHAWPDQPAASGSVQPDRWERARRREGAETMRGIAAAALRANAGAALDQADEAVAHGSILLSLAREQLPAHGQSAVSAALIEAVDRRLADHFEVLAELTTIIDVLTERLERQEGLQ